MRSKAAVVKPALWLGYAVAPAMGPFLLGCVLFASPSLISHQSFNPSVWFNVVTLSTLASYGVCLLAGIPMIALLKKIGKFTTSWIITWGAACYALIADVLVFAVMDPQIQGDSDWVVFQLTLFVTGLGIAVSWVFCIVAGITTPSPEFTSKLKVSAVKKVRKENGTQKTQKKQKVQKAIRTTPKKDTRVVKKRK